jgi:hypothetical protein
MTSAERQAAYDARRAALEDRVNALPPPLREFARAWRRSVELLGRAGPDGCALPLLEQFVADVAALVPAPAPPGKAAGEYTAGSGA